MEWTQSQANALDDFCHAWAQAQQVDPSYGQEPATNDEATDSDDS